MLRRLSAIGKSDSISFVDTFQPSNPEHEVLKKCDLRCHESFIRKTN